MTDNLTVAKNQHLFSKELLLFFTSIAAYENICRIISKLMEKFDVEGTDGDRETQSRNYHCRFAWLRCNIFGIPRVFLFLIGGSAGSAAWRHDSIMQFSLSRPMSYSWPAVHLHVSISLPACCLMRSQTPSWNWRRSTFRKAQAVFIQGQEVDVK